MSTQRTNAGRRPKVRPHIAAAIVLLLPLGITGTPAPAESLGDSSQASADIDSQGDPAPVPVVPGQQLPPSANGPSPQISDDLEQLMDDLPADLADVWAGWSVEDDGTVLIGVTSTQELPPILADRPGVEIEQRRFTEAYLDRVIDDAGARLDQLLAPGIEPGAASAWPYIAAVKVRENLVAFEVDAKYLDRREEIEKALANELAEGSARVTFGLVPDHQ